MRFALKVAFGVLALSGAMYLFVYPLRTYLSQEHQIAQVQRTIAVLGAEDAKLSSENAHLHQRSYVDRLARRYYGYVWPGQKAYEVLPPPAGQGAASSATSRHAAATASRAGRPGSPASWYAPLEFWDRL